MGAGRSEEQGVEAGRGTRIAGAGAHDPIPHGRVVVAHREASRVALHDAVLEVAGELGWRRVSVDAIASRAGVSRARFYRLFPNKEECLAEAYRRRVLRLVEELPDRLGRAETCGPLMQLAQLIETEPLLARGILAETRLAGGATSASREEVSERLTRAIRDACRETAKPRHSPPPIAATLIVAALESAVVESLTGTRAERFTDRIPALVGLALRTLVI